MQAPDLQDLIAVARITGRQPGRGGNYAVTIGGDGLLSLQTPVSVWLHRPAYRGSDLKRILASVTPFPREDGQFAVARLLTAKGGANRKGKVRLELAAEFPDLKDDPARELKGWWICTERSRLAAGDDVYVFQLLSLRVHREAEDGSREEEPAAEVTGYLETGAHGVLETRTLPGVVLSPPGSEASDEPQRGDARAPADDGSSFEVLVPLVPEYTTLDLPNGRVYVRLFDELIT